MIGTLELKPAPGDGVLGRFPGLVVFAPATRDGSALTGPLLDLCRDVATAGPFPGQGLMRGLAAALGNDGRLPPFGAVAETTSGVVVVAHGHVDIAVIAGDREIVVSGRHSLSWVERVVEGELSVVRAGPSLELPDDVLLRREPSLPEGVVPAGGFVLVPAAAPSNDPPRPRLAIGDSEEFRSVLLTEVPSQPSRAPLPLASELTASVVTPDAAGVIIQGVECSRGHFTDPDNLYCAICGISMAQRTKVLIDGVRPPLGFLVFDDAAIYALDDDYVVGREPYDDPRIKAGARPLVLDDQAGTVSRVHAELVLDGWHVRVVDRGSTNGTYLWDEHQSRWQRMDDGRSETIRTGARLAFGHRSCVFESPHGHRHT